MRSERLRPVVLIVSAVISIAGCSWCGCPRKDKCDLHYCGPEGPDYYKTVATTIDYPCIEEERPDQIAVTSAPHTILNRHKDQIWDMTLGQALQLALQNNKIIRVAGQFTAPLNSLMTNPNGVASVWDPSIAETGVLFGSRGVEAALSDFDAQLQVSSIWGFNNAAVNAPVAAVGAAAGSFLAQDTWAYNAALSKTFANGGQLTISNQWNYLNLVPGPPSVLFPSSYSGFARVGYTQPLWAGSGVEFTRIASPIGQGFSGVTGVSQGVSIARINEDMSLADFEAASVNLLRDVENTYWNLYLQYRLYHTAVVAHNSALRSWREAKAKLDIGGVTGFTPVDEAQARDQLFATRATAEQTLTNLYTAETNLRRLLGLPVNDGRIIRCVDEPLTAKFVPDWYNGLTEALSRRPELRKQKWAIKSLELQLKAAHSLTNPQLNFVSYYQVNGFGNDLISAQSNIFSPGSSAFSTLAEAEQTGWNVGFTFSMPIGFRSARTQVRQYEIRVAKAREGLAVQEMEVAQELAVSFQNVAAAYQTAQSNFNRRVAAEREVELYEWQYQVGTTTLAFVLQAQSSLASAEQNYYTSLANYAEAIADLNYRQGTLLDYHNVTLAESEWTPEAYKDAVRRAWARAHGIHTDFLGTEPEEFSIPPEQAIPAEQASVRSTLGGAAAASDAAGPMVPGTNPIPPAPPETKPKEETTPPAGGSTPPTNGGVEPKPATEPPM